MINQIKAAIEDCCKSLQKYAGNCIPTDENGYWNVNIGFINSEGREDETQFDIQPSKVDYIMGTCPELVELWKDFCKENGFKQNSVTYVCLANLG